MTEWFYSKEGISQGPLSEAEILDRISSGLLSADDYIRSAEMPDWVAAGSVPQFTGFFRIKSAGPSTAQQDPPKTRSRSYFVRHWRGELRLPVSYWVNLFFLTALMSFSLPYIVEKLTAVKSNLSVGLSGIGVWVVIWSITIWQMVGTWRSASRYSKERPGKVWGKLTKFLLIIGMVRAGNILVANCIPQVTEYARILTRSDQWPGHEVRLLNGGREIEIAGGISFGLHAEVRAQLDANPAVNLVHLNSPGGRIEEAVLIHDEIKKRRLSTYTATACMSACTIAFLGGERRILKQGAQLGFHSAHFPGLDASSISEINTQQATILTSHGVPEAFIERVVSTPAESMWTPPAAELQRAGIITEVSDGSDFGTSEFAALRDPARLEAELIKIPGFKALKEVQPAEFKALMQEVLPLVVSGAPKSVFGGAVRRHLLVNFQKSLPLADDKTILETTRIIIEHATLLVRVSGDLCWAYVDSGNVPPADYMKIIPGPSITAEMEAMAQAIRTRSTSRYVPTEKQLENPLEIMGKEMYAKFGDKTALITGEPPRDTAERKLACEIVIHTYESAMKLPNHDRVRVLRYMYAQ